MNHPPRDSLPSWRRLQRLATTSLQNPLQLRSEACGLRLDLSPQRIDTETWDTLLELAEACDLKSAISVQMNGGIVNQSEARAALHTRLRDLDRNGDARDPQVAAALKQMAEFEQAWRQHQLMGFSDEALTSIVNIGIGGSDLGPHLVCDALAPAANTRFVANMDPEDFRAQCADLDPRTTLFIVCSKSFSTAETKANTELARRWLKAAGCTDSKLNRHFLAITSSPERAREAGFDRDRILPMWDWVGGRFSLWSAVGISIVLTLGMETFRQLLRGAQAMDRHVAETPLAANMAVQLGLSDIWNHSFRHCESLAVLPYAQRLAMLPIHLQQLMMESSGKRVDNQGRTLAYHTGPVVWGAAGTTGQHSFHQLLHQGNRRFTTEFILPLTPQRREDIGQHRKLVAHCLAQLQALAQGEPAAVVAQRLREEGLPEDQMTALTPHQTIPGGRFCSLLTLPRLDAYHLGALLALYEHRVYCSAVLWDINPFDQWGVELGKRISQQLDPVLAGSSNLETPDNIAEAIEAYQSALKNFESQDQ